MQTHYMTYRMAFAIVVLLLTAVSFYRPIAAGHQHTFHPDGNGSIDQNYFIRKSVNIGGKKVLECDINPSSFPVASISSSILSSLSSSSSSSSNRQTDVMIAWRKKGRDVPIFIQSNGHPKYIDDQYQERIRMMAYGAIELKDIRTTDEGWYECSVLSHDRRISNGTSIYLAVNSAPVLGDVSPNFLIHRPGATIDLFCEAMANPEASLTWFKGGQELTKSNRVIFGHGRVQIRHLRSDDGGVYTCTFKNLVGQVSHSIKLIIEGSVYIMISPHNTTAIESSRVKLDCQAEGDPSNITYRWFRAGTLVAEVPDLSSRSRINPTDGSLVIRDVAKEDAGWYTCQPTNGLSPAPEARLFLNVTYPPQILPFPLRLYLPTGMAGRVECPVDANPPAMRVTWSINERQVDVTRLSRMRIGADGSLVIERVEKEDEARYSCTAYSSIGSGKMSNPVQVIVRDPPYFLTRPRPLYQRHPGQSVTMPCVANGDPRPIITWKKVNGSFPQSTTKVRFDGGNLTILHLDESDHGHYECSATSVVASVTTTTIVIIEFRARHPPDIVSVDAEVSSARVTWLPGYEAGNPLSYVVRYRPFLYDDWQTLSALSEDTTAVTVKDLIPGTKYTFVVLALSSTGIAQSSSDFIVTTKGSLVPTDNPGRTFESTKTEFHQATLEIVQKPVKIQDQRPSPPENFTGTRLSSTAIRLSWSQPRSSPIPISSYLIEYKTMGQWLPLASDTFLSSNVTSYEWRTASLGIIYEFRIISRSRLTSSRPSDTAIVGDVELSGMQTKQWSSLSSALGLVAAVVFVVMSLVVFVVLVRFTRKGNARETTFLRYDKVKYFDPNQAGADKGVQDFEPENRQSERRGAAKTKTTMTREEYLDGGGGGEEGDDRVREAIIRRLEVRSMIETPI